MNSPAEGSSQALVSMQRTYRYLSCWIETDLEVVGCQCPRGSLAPRRLPRPWYGSRQPQDDDGPDGSSYRAGCRDHGHPTAAPEHRFAPWAPGSRRRSCGRCWPWPCSRWWARWAPPEGGQGRDLDVLAFVLLLAAPVALLRPVGAAQRSAWPSASVMAYLALDYPKGPIFLGLRLRRVRERRGAQDGGASPPACWWGTWWSRWILPAFGDGDWPDWALAGAGRLAARAGLGRRGTIRARLRRAAEARPPATRRRRRGPARSACASPGAARRRAHHPSLINVQAPGWPCTSPRRPETTRPGAPCSPIQGGGQGRPRGTASVVYVLRRRRGAPPAPRRPGRPRRRR